MKFNLLLMLTLMELTNFSYCAWTWFPDFQRGKVIQDRWARWKSEIASGLYINSRSAVEKVCGKWKDNPECSKALGRPKDEDVENCDRFCCSIGYMTGNCYFAGLSAGVSVKNPWGPGDTKINPAGIKIYSACKCTNDWKDATCGPDGSFIGIRCPFDKSACARKCCRDGHTGGRCRGFLSTKCKCD